MKLAPRFKFKESLDLLIEINYLAVIFIIPLYFSVIFPTYNIFELSKFSVFKILTCLLLFLTITKLIFFKNTLSFLKKQILIPLIFVFGLGLSILASINPVQSFFGSYDRQSGYLSYLFYFLWLVLLVFNLKTTDNHLSRTDGEDKLPGKIKRVIQVAVFSGFLVSLYGVLQILGIDFLSWPEDPLLTRRTLATFGQPNFLASWLLLVIPLSAYLFYKNKKFLLKFFYLLVTLVQLACLFFTSSRGGLVALGLTGLLFIGYVLIFAKLKKINKFFISLALLLLIISSLWGLNIFFPGRFSSLVDFQGGSLAARLNFYQAATDAIIKKPVFGYGLENSGEVFISYYQPDWGVYGDVGATTDKAHNLLLDITLATGFFGLALFVSLYYYFFWLAKDNIKKKKFSGVSLSLALGGAAYLLSLLFSFTIVAGEIYFWLFLAVLAVINIDEADKGNARADSGRRVSPLIKTGLSLLTFLIISGGIYYEFRVLIADYYFNKLYYVLADRQYLTAFVLADYANQASPNPVNKQYYARFLGDKLSDFFPEIEELLVKKVAQRKLQEVNNRLEARGYENIYVKAKINSALGNYQVAENYFKEILGLSPYWPKTYIDLARALTREARFQEAVASYRLAEASLPDLNDSRFNELHKNILKVYRKVIFQELANIYFSLKDYPAAEKYYQAAYLSDINDFTLFKNIADTYYQRGDFDQALEYSWRGARRNPGDYNWLLAISALYRAKGDGAMSRQYLDAALRLAPDNEELIRLRSQY